MTLLSLSGLSAGQVIAARLRTQKRTALRTHQLRVRSRVRRRPTLLAMSDSWSMQLAIDAHEMDVVRVRPQRFDTGPQVHLKVRTGPLLVYCLDSKAVTSIAAAWAQAQASSAHLLSTTSSRPAPAATQRSLPSRQGHAFAASDVVAEGYQRWDVAAPTPGQDFALVSTDWLTVRVHDRSALETHTHAWAGAVALAARCMPGVTTNFDQLLRAAFDRELAYRYRDEPTPSRRTRRGR
jgi:hypothetical protein